jgi:hypothetical protein
MKRYINNKMMDALKRILEDAKMEDADFSKELKEEIKLYMDTWIIFPLQQIIEELEK